MNQDKAGVQVPRLGFIGTGWIGRMRLQALLQTGRPTFCTVYDPSSEAATAAAALAADIAVTTSLGDLLEADIDGVVIATPSAMHAEQCLAALAAGHAVFCQKPLARSYAETHRVVTAARNADKLLAVDFCYRYLQGMEQLRRIIAAGELGDIFSADLVFHNAYGPDKPWFYSVDSAGGGCVMDLGIHLVDLALWLLGGNEVNSLSATLFHQGRKMWPPFAVVEDYAVAEFALTMTLVRLCCSWNLHAGRDAIIEARFYGTKGGAIVRNVGGSFYDFEVCTCNRTAERMLGGYPDDWGGRAFLHWVDRLAGGNAYDPRVEQVEQVALVIDRIYSR